MVESTCEWCGDDFTYYPSDSSGRFCSNDCHWEFKRSDDNPRKAELECAECGEVFYKPPSNVNDAENHFCSRGCQGKFKRDPASPTSSACSGCGQVFRLKADLAEHFKKEHFDGRATSDSQCPTCGQSFSDRRGMRIHHHAVHDESLVPTVSRTCKNCGVEFTVPEKDLEFHEYDFCSHECSYQHGRGGKGTECVRRILTPKGEHWEEIAYRVRERADGECEMCGEDTPTHGRPGLQVHHLVPIRCGGTHADWNLVAVCPSCHGRAEAKANELFTRYLWGGDECLSNRPRDESGRFVEMQSSMQG